MNEGVQTVHWIGPYYEGEKPLPLIVEFTNVDVDMSGWELEVVMTVDGVIRELASAAEWVAGADNQARYQWGDGDLAPAEGAEWSDCWVWVWSGNGTYRFASEAVRFLVYRSPSVPVV